MKQKRLLLTGFEPFGGRGINSSWELIKGFSGIRDKYLVETACLPVTHKKARKALDPYLKKFDPHIVVCFGESPDDFFALERVAINLADFPGRKDNAGKTVIATPLSKKGPAAYFSTLPLEKIHKALTAKKIPVQYSLSAGAYLCNEIFYHTMQKTAKKKKVKAGFIHVPRLPEEKGALRQRLKAIYTKDPLAAILSALED